MQAGLCETLGHKCEPSITFPKNVLFSRVCLKNIEPPRFDGLGVHPFQNKTLYNIDSIGGFSTSCFNNTPKWPSSHRHVLMAPLKWPARCAVVAGRWEATTPPPAAMGNFDMAKSVSKAWYPGGTHPNSRWMDVYSSMAIINVHSSPYDHQPWNWEYETKNCGFLPPKIMGMDCYGLEPFPLWNGKLCPYLG